MRKLIAIIPARGGSKRLKNKNIYPLLGKPLIAYSIEACLKSKHVSEVFVSTEDQAIADVSINYGAKILWRPAHLADDQTPKMMAIRQAVNALDDQGVMFDDVAIIQANSPEIGAVHIDSSYVFMLENQLWEVMSADESGIQNAALRLVKKDVVFQPFLSAHCGFIAINLMDVHTIEDIHRLEQKMA